MKKNYTCLVVMIAVFLLGNKTMAQKKGQNKPANLVNGISPVVTQTQIDGIQTQIAETQKQVDTTKSDNAHLSAKIDVLEKNFTEFKSKISDEDKSTVIGVVKWKTLDDIDVYEYNQVSKKFDIVEGLNVDSIRFETLDGFITSIFVYSEDDTKVFMNTNAPIRLSQKRFNDTEYLKCYYKGRWQYIKTYDLLCYKPVRNYIPDNSSFSLDRKNRSHNFTKGVGINTIFDLRLYTDAFAALGSEPNGIVTTEAYFRQVLHRYNFRNAGIYAFSNLKINFNVSKFDSKIAFVDSSNFSRTALFQRSWLNTDISISILKGWLAKRSVSSWYIDAGAGLSLSKLGGMNDTSDITSSVLFIQPGADLNVSDNIGITFSSRIIYHYSPQIDFNEQGGERIFIRPTVGFFWNPMGNESSRIFARLIYTVETSDRKKHYPQLQFGYTLKLSSLGK